MNHGTDYSYWPFPAIQFPYFISGYITNVNFNPNEAKQKIEIEKKAEENKKNKKDKVTKALIHIENLQAGTVSNASGIFTGKNIQIGWSSHGKSNSGFGSLGGRNNKVNKNTNVVYDNDQIDTPIDGREVLYERK